MISFETTLRSHIPQLSVPATVYSQHQQHRSSILTPNGQHSYKSQDSSIIAMHCWVHTLLTKKRKDTDDWYRPPVSLPLSWDKYFQPLRPGVNSFPESLSRTFLFIFVNLAASSNLLQASANLWQYLDNYIQAPLSPLELVGWAPPGPLGLQGILRCLLPPYLAHGTHMSVALFPRL